MEDRIDFGLLRAALAGMPDSAEDGTGGSRAAAVAVVLRDRPAGTQVLLIRRAARHGDPWSGQMGLPGGHREPGDPSLLATAERETAEEVGIGLGSHARLLGVLPDVIARTEGRMDTMRVLPFVFALTREVSIEVGSEVREALWARLGPLARGECDTTLRVACRGNHVDRPAWNVQGRIVSGLTHRMLCSLLGALRQTAPQPDGAARG